MLVVSLINFGVKNQVPQVSFKIIVGDSISFHTLKSNMNLFGSNMILFGYDLMLFGSIFKFQEPSIMLVAGVINQVPQVSFKLVVGDLMLVSSYEFADIIFCESWVFLKLYQIMELKHSLSTFPGILYLSI